MHLLIITYLIVESTVVNLLVFFLFLLRLTLCSVFNELRFV